MRGSDDTARIEAGRRLGWNVIQSDDFTLRKRGEQVIVEGSGQGHGVGLCQAGAREMAEEGSDFSPNPCSLLPKYNGHQPRPGVYEEALEAHSSVVTEFPLIRTLAAFSPSLIWTTLADPGFVRTRTRTPSGFWKLA